jgi:hypothetical protein
MAAGLPLLAKFQSRLTTNLPHFHVRFARLLPEKIAVNLLMAVFKENRFSTIATLRHVVRETGYHAGQTRHERKLNMNQN